MMQISSLQNSRVKQVVRLNNRRYRDEQRLTVVEGVREAGQALAAGIVPREAYLCGDLISGAQAVGVVEKLKQLSHDEVTKVFEVTPPVFAKMAYRGESGGILLVIDYQEHTPDDLLQVEPPLLIVLDSAEKPGNIGAILRTADGAGVTGLVLCGDGGSGTDIHNPNVIRASLGAIFTVPVISMPAREAMAWLKAAGIKVVATTPQAHDLYTQVSLKGPLAVIMGSEAYGLDRDWLRAADIQISIPMAGVVDSLNLSVSTALIVYEAVRQRNLSIELD